MLLQLVSFVYNLLTHFCGEKLMLPLFTALSLQHFPLSHNGFEPLHAFGFTLGEADIDVGVDGVGLGVADPTEVVADAVFPMDVVDFSIELLAVGVADAVIDAVIDAVDDDDGVTVVFVPTAKCMIANERKMFMNSYDSKRETSRNYFVKD